MEKDLIKFYDNITFINKELARYEDEKGNIQILPIGQLICSLNYSEISAKEHDSAVFNNILDKDITYNKITVKKPISKFEKTGNKKDKNTLIEEDVEVTQVWIIRNGLNVFKSYNNLDEAKEVLNNINNKILKQAELI